MTAPTDLDRLGPLTDDLFRAVLVPFEDPPEEETVRMALAALAYVTARILAASADLEMVAFYYAILHARLLEDAAGGAPVQ